MHFILGTFLTFWCSSSLPCCVPMLFFGAFLLCIFSFFWSYLNWYFPFLFFYAGVGEGFFKLLQLPGSMSFFCFFVQILNFQSMFFFFSLSFFFLIVCFVSIFKGGFSFYFSFQKNIFSTFLAHVLQLVFLIKHLLSI